MIPPRYSKRSASNRLGRKSSGTGTGFTFRYPVGDGTRPVPLNLREMLAGHLRSLLEVLNPTWKGKQVRIDGYSSLGEPDLIHPLFPDENQSYRSSGDRLDIYEPRLTYIRNLVESLQSIIDFEHGRKKVRIDGFRLKRPEQWLRPGGGAFDILAQAAGRCNLQCRFCYNLGSPPAFQAIPRPVEEEFKEIQTRIEYYVPESKLGLFPDMGSPCEMLTHPRIFDILTALRKKSTELLRIPTNGAKLTPEIIQALTHFQPIFVDLSLNSSSPGRRQWLMNDPHPEVALGAPAALLSARLPYSVVIVPWPFPSIEEMIEDLIRTVSYSSGFNPAYIQISLPGYSHRFSEEPLFDREEVWTRLREEIRRLRTLTDCPLILRPGLYEEYPDTEAIDTPRLSGVVKHSPAARAGLLIGDRLTGINGLPVKNRIQARSLLNMIQDGRLEKIPIRVDRLGRPVDLSMTLTNYEYPFDPGSVPYAGCVFASAGVPLDWMEKLRALIVREEAREVLILTSTLVRPILEKRLHEHLFLSGVQWHCRVPANRYFGGIIIMGDLLVVEDFIEAVQGFRQEGQVTPDLVVIPSSPFHLSGWGRDLTGRVYKDIERITGIPVGLIECDPIFD